MKCFHFQLQLLCSTMKFTVLFLNLAKIHIFIPKCTEGGWGGGGSTGLGNIHKKLFFL